MSAARRVPPGPPPITNILGMLRLFSEFNKDLLGTLRRSLAKYGDIYTYKFGNLHQVVITHPDHIYQILVAQTAKFRKNRDYYDPKVGLARFLGNGLLTSDFDFWKRQRHLVAPAFHAKRIAAYADTMVDYTVKMLQTWPDGARLDINAEMTRLTMLIAARALFNTDVSGDVERVGVAMEAIQAIGGQQSLVPPWVPTPTELRGRRATRVLDDIIYRMINERRASGEDNGDLLSMLLLAEDEDGNRMTPQQARDEAVTLFLAGHETTANALNWTWYLLAQHPEVAAKLYDELDTALAGQPPTLADLDRLPYTEKVIKESMRLYPPAYAFSREALEDVELDEYIIPKGSVVFVAGYFTHRDPRWFPDPERFEPERWDPDNEKQMRKYAYLPFGGGPRICIGNGFAMMEARLVLATIANRYRLTLDPGQTVEKRPLITLKPKGGLPMTVHVRERVKGPVREAVPL